MCWIETVAVESARGELKRSFEEVQTPHGTVDNVYRAQSLRPHTMLAHDILYRSVLHHPGNSLPPWFLECVAVYTSLLNRCTYALTHHTTNLRRLLGWIRRLCCLDRRLLSLSKLWTALDRGHQKHLSSGQGIGICQTVCRHERLHGQTQLGCNRSQSIPCFERVGYRSR